MLKQLLWYSWCCAVVGAMIWARTYEAPVVPPSRAVFEERHRISYDVYASQDFSHAYDLLAAAFAGKELDRQYCFYAKAAHQLSGAGASVTVWDLTYQDYKVIESNGSSCRVRSKWTVFYVLGHTKHSHIRGNAYDVIFDLRKDADGWKIIHSEIVGENNLA